MSRQYESDLKELLHTLVDRVQKADEPLLYDLYLPQNVPGVPRISLIDWIEARNRKRNRT